MNLLKRLLRIGKKNPRTTTLGIIGGLLVILSAFQALLDDDPKTVFELDVVLEAAVGIVVILWGILTKDADDEDDEEEKADPEDPDDPGRVVI